MTPYSNRPNLPSQATRRRGRRWASAACLLGLIVLVEVALAYLLSWVETPRQICFVPIVVAEYQARPIAACVRAAGTPTAWREQSFFAETLRVDTTRQGILDKLDSLARRGNEQPVVILLSTLALQAGDGDVYLLPSDAKPDDASTWLRLRDVLVKLQACPTRQKLLVLDLMPATCSRLGCVHSDLGAAIPRELKAVNDPERWVLCSHSAGQSSNILADTGVSAFTYYFQQALRGQVDGGADGHVSVTAAAAFTRQRVERWSMLNGGDRQTPALFGAASDFTLVAIEPSATIAPASPSAREYPTWLMDAWKARDVGYDAGHHRLAPCLFQRQQALLLATEQAWRAGLSEPSLRKLWLAECEQVHESLQRITKDVPWCGRLACTPNVNVQAGRPHHEIFDDWWRRLQQQLGNAKAGEVERIKNHAIDELRGKLSATDLDAIVVAHALADARLDPGTIRLYDRILHPTPQTTPRTGRTLRVRQLADLSLHAEAFGWPTEVIETTLRATELAENATAQVSLLPGYQTLLDEPAQHRHAGEIRLWTRGYANLDEAKQRLNQGIDQFERLVRVNDEWQRDQMLLDEAMAELAGYTGALEAMPSWRAAWMDAVASARLLADVLQPRAEDTKKSRDRWNDQVGKLEAQAITAAAHARELRQHLHTLRAPFAREELNRLERQCRAPHADVVTLRTVHALLRTSVPKLRAEDRANLWQAASVLSRRLHEETVALDRLDHGAKKPVALVENKTPNAADEALRAEWRVRSQLALFELAGVPEPSLRSVRLELERCLARRNDAANWCELGSSMRQLHADHLPQQHRQEIAWHRRERLAWGLAPFERYPGADDGELSPTVPALRDARQRQENWQREHSRYLARDYQGLNLECPGVVAARDFYARTTEGDDAHVRLKVAEPVEGLTLKTPYAHFSLEVTRQMPRGVFGPVELQFHRADEHWLEIAPESASLGDLGEAMQPRTQTNKVPLKVTRQAMAARSGLPAPLGFLVEARFAGRSWHHLVTTPIPHDGRDVQILVSVDPREPETTVNEIRVRPGNTRQPHYFYVKNLTNRIRKVHVEISEAARVPAEPGAPNPLLLADASARVLYKSRQPMTLRPDGVDRIDLEEMAGQELRGPLHIRVLDQDRDKELETRVVRVAMLPPHEYVKVGEVRFAPGVEGNNKWLAQVQTAQRVAGPAIAAELVLPMRRIPGLLGIGGGTLQLELPTNAKGPRMLFAEKIRLQNDDQEGPVYVNIDGVPRAFVYRTTFQRNGAATQPARDERPAVRLVAPLSVMTGVTCLVEVEVDNAPAGSKLEVALGRTPDGASFRAEVLREFADAKQQRIGVEITKGALVFDASIKDWTATFDTKAIVGARTLRARLLDATGREIAHATQPVVIDNTAPIARFAPPPPAQVKRGSTFQVQAEASDVESGIAQVVFFVGQPEKGEIPASAVKLNAMPANKTATMWGTTVSVPVDHQGPLPISVRVVNNAGMASVDTFTVGVIDGEPGKTGLGEIRGRVVEGPRVQPSLVVILSDERGKEIARTRTGPDGTFVFERLPPGQYRLLCVKPESQRRATMGVTVDADRMSKADLSLSL